MKNYLSVMDSAGNFTAPGWVRKSLEGLDRFIGAGDKAEKIVGKMEREGIGSNSSIELLYEFSEDFYAAWLASSTEIIGKIGFDEVCKIFSTFKRVYFVSWPPEMLDAVDSFRGEIEIFRGESRSSFESGIIGLSWTTHERIARNFAHRHRDGVVLRGKIRKENVWAFYCDECEIVALSDYVKNLDVF